MSQNFTVDDSDATLVYGPGWGVESPEDPALHNYFQSTYHASRTLGANVNMSFSGIAIYFFGSMGPNHGNYTVRYDNFIQLLSAQADTLRYRQLLFSAHFAAGDHSLTFTNTDTNQSWLDLDFVTVTRAGNTSVPSVFSSTISPLSVASKTTQASMSSPAPPSSIAEAPSQSKSNTVTLVLAMVFGILLLFLLVGVALYLLRCRRRAKPSPPHYGVDTAAFYSGTQSNMNQLSAHPFTYDTSPLDSSGINNIANHALNDESGVEMQQHGNHIPRLPASRPWSPFSTPISRIFSPTKEGADSMKSTFLKV